MSLELSKKMRFLITGGSGFIGSKLCPELVANGHEVIILSRNPEKTESKFNHKIKAVSKLDDVSQAIDIIINLAGETIDGRWTDGKKQKMLNSRISITKAVVDFISKQEKKPELLISGSAIGYYGSSSDMEFTESSNAADDGFTHQLCKKWEDAASQAGKLGVNVCLIRTGIVLSKDGGALKKMILPFKLGLGGKFGKGNQVMSWIHISDWVGLVSHVINNNISGPVNFTAPNPVTNKEFVEALGKALHRPAFFTIPAINIKLIFGEMGERLLLEGQRVLPEKALTSGYKFNYPDIEQAFNGLFDH